MVRFLGKEPQLIHFSELLLGDTDFSEIAKVSIGGNHEGFFKAMCLLVGKEDESFDQSCQQINEWLVTMLGNEITKRQKRKKKTATPVTESRQTLEYLQSTTFATLVQSNPTALRSHAGMVVVVITLTRLFNEKIRIGIVAESKRLQGAPQKEVIVDAKREVNSFLGWAISQIMNFYKEELNGDWTDEDQKENAQKHIYYLRTMRVLHCDVIGDLDYLENCYSDHLQLENNGGLTLVSHEYFEFGTFLMNIIVRSLTQTHITNEGNEAWTKGMARVKAEFATIERRFLALGEDYTELDTEAKVSVLERLVQKAAHARHGVEWKIYKELTVKRKGANYVGNAHREELKAISKGSEISTLPKEALKKRKRP
jgi:hypothetical protein